MVITMTQDTVKDEQLPSSVPHFNFEMDSVPSSPTPLSGAASNGTLMSKETVVPDISPLTPSCDSENTAFGSLHSRESAEEVKTPINSPQPEPEKLSGEFGPKESLDIGEIDPTGDDNPLLKDIPWHVRRVVSLHDDTALPTITFRYFLLSFLFVLPGAFLSQMACFRTTSAPYSIFFVQIASNYAGEWLAATLPAWQIRIPFTNLGFNLNPGPFSVKEHVLVVICAASGATYNLAYSPISIAELFFGQKFHPAIAIVFMWTVVWVGYSYAAIARQFLVYDPQYPWYQALCQTALFETQKNQRENPSPVSRRQMMVFFLALLGVFMWQFLPEFVFPMLSSLSFLCWVAPHNEIANFIGSGLGGMGFLNLSLDWSNIGNQGTMGSLFLTPWWTQVIVFLAFVVNCWVLIPASKWGGMTQWNHHLMSNKLFQENGTHYPVLRLITHQRTFNETAYAEYGPIFMGAQQLWGMFFDYASFTSALFWMALFGWPQLKSIWFKFRERQRSGYITSINQQYNDQLNVLMRSYREVPLSWFFVVFLCSFVPTIVLLARGYFFIPLWTYFMALATGAIVVAPLGWLYAVSNFQLPTGSTNELLYGLMINSVQGHKNPVGAMVYGTIAGDAWYRAQIMLQDQKLGHYMHIPPRAVFFSQMFGSFIGVPVNYGVIRWILNTKHEYLNGTRMDPLHQWTGQQLITNLTVSTEYVLIGPKRLFKQALFHPVSYGFLMGAIAPTMLFLLHWKFPRAKFNLWNCTIFFCALSTFYGNVSTGYVSGLIGGYVVMYWAYRKRYETWARYNYILAAAFDAGFNFNILAIFICFSAAKTVAMPAWWGNNGDNVERCFALQPP